METKTISNISSATITVSSAFSTAPNPNAPYILETASLQPTQWRVVSITENDDTTYTVSALEHNSGKYAFVEDGTALPTRNISTMTEILDPPVGLSVSEKIVTINGAIKAKVNAFDNDICEIE